MFTFYCSESLQVIPYSFLQQRKKLLENTRQECYIIRDFTCACHISVISLITVACNISLSILLINVSNISKKMLFNILQSICCSTCSSHCFIVSNISIRSLFNVSLAFEVAYETRITKNLKSLDHVWIDLIARI